MSSTEPRSTTYIRLGIWTAIATIIIICTTITLIIFIRLSFCQNSTKTNTATVNNHENLQKSNMSQTHIPTKSLNFKLEIHNKDSTDSDLKTSKQTTPIDNVNGLNNDDIDFLSPVTKYNYNNSPRKSLKGVFNRNGSISAIDNINSFSLSPDPKHSQTPQPRYNNTEKMIYSGDSFFGKPRNSSSSPKSRTPDIHPTGTLLNESKDFNPFLINDKPNIYSKRTNLPEYHPNIINKSKEENSLSMHINLHTKEHKNQKELYNIMKTPLFGQNMKPDKLEEENSTPCSKSLKSKNQKQNKEEVNSRKEKESSENNNNELKNLNATTITDKSTTEQRIPHSIAYSYNNYKKNNNNKGENMINDSGDISDESENLEIDDPSMFGLTINNNRNSNQIKPSNDKSVSYNASKQDISNFTESLNISNFENINPQSIKLFYKEINELNKKLQETIKELKEAENKNLVLQNSINNRKLDQKEKYLNKQINKFENDREDLEQDISYFKKEAEHIKNEKEIFEKEKTDFNGVKIDVSSVINEILFVLNNYTAGYLDNGQKNALNKRLDKLNQIVWDDNKRYSNSNSDILTKSYNDSSISGFKEK